MNYRRLNNHSLGWQERVCTATRTCAHPTPAERRARGAEGAWAAHASIMETHVCKASVFYSNRNAKQQAFVAQILPIFLAFFGGFWFFFGFFASLQCKTSVNHCSYGKSAVRLREHWQKEKSSRQNTQGWNFSPQVRLNSLLKKLSENLIIDKT